MKTNTIIMVALFASIFTSCIKEDMDCPKDEIQATMDPQANAILTISVTDKEESRDSALSEESIDNMTVLVFNNNKKLVKTISISKDIIEKGNRAGNYSIGIHTSTGYHFFYVLANVSEEIINNKPFETGDHFNDIIGTIIHQSHEMFVTAESPRILLTAGDNTIHIDLIQP